MKKAELIMTLLTEYYPKAHCELNFRNCFELTVMVQLSAQTTDEIVNKIAPNLFTEIKNWRSLAKLNQKKLENIIYTSGFYRSKAKRLIACAQMIWQNYNGEVPRTMEELIKLPGIGRKTANIILLECFGIVDGIAVDTHVARLSQRLGFSKEKEANKIEKDLLSLLPKSWWSKVNHLFIALGRQYCQAKKTDCRNCPLKNICPSFNLF